MDNTHDKNMRPIIGITMGDPAGIGPEIIVKTLTNAHMYAKCRPIVIGDAQTVQAISGSLGLTLRVNAVTAVGKALFTPGTIDVFDLKNVDMNSLEYGRVSAMAGQAAFQAIVKTITLALEGSVHATVTAPINKEAIKKAGHAFAGHTEIYAARTKTSDYAMMLAEDNVRVVHVSTHVSLRQACDAVKTARVLATIKLAHTACQRLGIPHPRIGVAGLNPHAGENGLFGWEEQTEIIPAIEKAQRIGIDASGPVPADTIFPKTQGGMYDIVVAMYHDQGHIPLKVLGFRYDRRAGEWESVRGVNITLGLPIIRTSVDHGTAFDVAWQGKANPDSMVMAIDYAIRMAMRQ